MFRALLILAVVALAVGKCAGIGEKKDRPPTDLLATVNQENVAAADAATDGAATVSPEIEQAEARATPKIEETTDGIEKVNDVDMLSPSKGAKAETEHDIEVAAAIFKATSVALDSGQPERWKMAGKSGYVVVSAESEYGDSVCRNVYSTIIDHGNQTQSATRRWCRSETEEWVEIE